MQKLAFLLLVTFILMMILGGGCVRAAASEPAGPAASTVSKVPSGSPWG